MRVAGVDPGVSGAIAVLDTETASLSVHDFPKLAVSVNGKNRSIIDFDATWALVFALAANGIDLCVLEAPGRRGSQNAAAGVTFGEAAGAIQMAVVAAGIPRRLAQPNEWKKAVGLPVRGERKERKDESRLAAKRLFPAHQSYFARVLDADRAEAALLAHYGKTLIGVKV